jgi:hypothetical protein
MKTDGQSYYRAIRGHWKAEGKGIAATQWDNPNIIMQIQQPRNRR